MVDSIREVKKYLKKYHKPDEPIPAKSRDRVLRGLARGIRRNPKLQENLPCHMCYNIGGPILPVAMKVCNGCLQKVLKKHSQRVIQREFLDYYCDMCFGRTFTIYLINPKICKKCGMNIGRKHQRNLAKVQAANYKNALKRSGLRQIF